MLLFKSLEIYERFKENYVKQIEKDEFLSSCQSFSEDLIYHESLEAICQSNTEIHKKSLSICLVIQHVFFHLVSELFLLI